MFSSPRSVCRNKNKLTSYKSRGNRTNNNKDKRKYPARRNGRSLSKIRRRKAPKRKNILTRSSGNVHKSNKKPRTRHDSKRYNTNTNKLHPRRRRESSYSSSDSSSTKSTIKSHRIGLKKDRKTNPKINKTKEPFIYTKFLRYSEILCYLKDLESRFPKRVRVESIGTSIKDKEIYMARLSTDVDETIKLKNIVVIDAALHAREWITVSTILYFVENLVKHTRLLELMDIYVIPCANPDGYEFTHTDDRLWRKNLNSNGSSDPCENGVDLNRNFPYAFGGSGGSGDKVDSEYRGPFALSEPESRSLAGVFEKYSGRIKLYISLHAYGSMILYPYGFSRMEPHDAKDLMDCGIAAQQAIYRKGNKRYFRVGSSCRLLYRVNGCSIDYARGSHNVKFSYLVELPKFGRSGFEPKPSKIREIGIETYAGISAMIRHVHNYYLQKKEKPQVKPMLNAVLEDSASSMFDYEMSQV